MIHLQTIQKKLWHDKYVRDVFVDFNTDGIYLYYHNKKDENFVPSDYKAGVISSIENVYNWWMSKVRD